MYTVYFRADDNFADIQATYGSGSCYMFHVNSRQTGLGVQGENPWSQLAARYHTAGNTGEVCGDVYMYMYLRI